MPLSLMCRLLFQITLALALGLLCHVKRLLMVFSGIAQASSKLPALKLEWKELTTGKQQWTVF